MYIYIYIFTYLFIYLFAYLFIYLFIFSLFSILDRYPLNNWMSSQAATTPVSLSSTNLAFFLQSTWRWPSKTPRSMGLGDPIRNCGMERGCLTMQPCCRHTAQTSSLFSIMAGAAPQCLLIRREVNSNGIYGSQFGSHGQTSMTHPKTKVLCPNSLICQAAPSLKYFETLVQNVANVGSYFVHETLVRTTRHLQRLPIPQLSSWPQTKPALPPQTCSMSPGQ